MKKRTRLQTRRCHSVRLWVVLCALSIMFTSCFKDGLNDFEGLKHPLHLQGSFNPALGIPVGYGEMTINELLGMLDSSLERYVRIDEANDLLTIMYDTTIRYTYIYEGSTQGAKGDGDTDSTNVLHQYFDGEVDIDLFSGMNMLPDDLEIRNALLSLEADVMAYATAQTAAQLEYYDVTVSIDSLALIATNAAGEVYSLPLVTDSLVVNNLLDGEHLVLVNDGDLSDLVRIRPNRIRYQGRLNIQLGDDFWMRDFSQFVADSLGIDSVSIDADFDLVFPLSVYFSELSYADTVDVSIADGQVWDQVKLEESYLVVELQNGLPLDLQLRLDCADSNDVELMHVLGEEWTTISGAQLRYEGSELDCYVAASPNTSVIKVPIDTQRLDYLRRMRKLHYRVRVATADATNHSIVAVQGKDALAIRVYTQLSPTITIDIPLSNDEDNEEE